MKKNNNIFYEIQPHLFYDNSNSGVGDYKGIEKKISYFSVLGIDNLVFRSILENYVDLLSNKAINKHYGSLEDFENLVLNLKSKNINTYMEFDFKEFQNYLTYLKNYEIITNNNSKYDETITQTISHYIDKNDIQDLKFEWYSSEKINGFKTIIDFYSKFSIKGIIFKNFEFIASKKNEISNDTFHILSELFQYIKKTNSRFLLIAKSDKKEVLKNKKFLKLLKINKFSALINDNFSKYWLSKKHPYDILKKYKPWKLKKWLIENYFYSKANIMSINRKTEGRIASRLVKNHKNLDYLQKMLFAIQILSFNQPYIFQGDEIGQDNIGFTTYKEFNDYSYNQTKRFLSTRGISSETFFNSRSKLTFLNMITPLSWTKDNNVSFTKSGKFYLKKSKNFKTNNVWDQIDDQTSVFNFYKSLIHFRKMFFSENFNKKKNQKIIFSINPNVFKTKFLINNEIYYLIINLSEKTINYKVNYIFKKVFSNYQKENEEYIHQLRPFELIFIKIK